jgi:hypothetical protein
VPLRVEVQQQHAMAEGGEGRCGVYGRRRLAAPAFLIYHCYRSHSVSASTKQFVRTLALPCRANFLSIKPGFLKPLRERSQHLSIKFIPNYAGNVKEKEANRRF